MFPAKVKVFHYAATILLVCAGAYALYSVASYKLLPGKYAHVFTEIQRLNGKVEVDMFGRGWPRSFGPKVRVDLSRTPISDNGLLKIAAIDELEILLLAETGISDVGLVPLKEAKSLVYLRLDDTAVSDTGMQTVGEMRQISSLFLK